MIVFPSKVKDQKSFYEPVADLFEVSIFCKRGIKKAPVLPDPVLARAKMSFPSSAKGIAFSVKMQVEACAQFVHLP